MKFSFAAVASAVLSSSLSVEASFLRDVVKTSNLKSNIEADLLAKATPLEEYRNQLKSQGLELAGNSRHLAEDEGNDDYYMDADDMHSFSGYALKYERCQPVQRFSEDAILAGEYTPMVTNDIVVLRLCPSNTCSTGSHMGCYYNYSEYAIDINDYVRIMLRYTMDKKEQLCDWCEQCGAQRRLEENDKEDEAENNENDREENQEEEDDKEDEKDQDEDADEEDEEEDNADEEENQKEDEVDEEEEDNQEDNEEDIEEEEEEEVEQDNADDQADDYYNNAAGDDYYNDGDDDAYLDESSECYNYKSYCYDGYGNSVCNAENDDGYFLDTEGYLDYIGCVKANGYYLRPRCDGSKQTISMGIYYDPFCSEYIGDKVSIGNLGFGIRSDAFKDFYSNVDCLDCSSSSYAPTFDANSNVCNSLFTNSAVCSANMQYDVFETYDDETTTCSFIQSLTHDTYDQYGQLYTKNVGSTTSKREIKPSQKIGLAVSIALCVLLALYSCFLHHSITNLLIKSLSHTDLLPPSRSRRRSNSTRRSRGSRRQVDSDTDEDDDQEWVNRGKGKR